MFEATPRSRAGGSRPVSGLILVTVVSALFSLWATPPTAQGQEKESLRLEDLSFMAGCWRGDLNGGGVVEERFTLPAGGIMLGNSRTLAGGKVRFFEFFRIDTQGSGVVYTPYPAGRTSVSFQWVRGSEQTAVFENLEHDFPQRIVYQRADREDRRVLVARIEDAAGERTQEFTMDRVPCAPE